MLHQGWLRHVMILNQDFPEMNGRRRLHARPRCSHSSTARREGAISQERWACSCNAVCDLIQNLHFCGNNNAGHPAMSMQDVIQTFQFSQAWGTRAAAEATEGRSRPGSPKYNLLAGPIICCTSKASSWDVKIHLGDRKIQWRILNTFPRHKDEWSLSPLM